MLYVVIVLLIALVAVTIRYILYRRQITDICRQLQFLENDITNHKIRTSISDKEIRMLAEQINRIYDTGNQTKIALLEQDKRLKETLTNVSHDIRTPLTSLKGYFQLLMSEEDAEQKLKYAQVMSERMNNLSDLLDELFTYTKLQNQDYKIECSNQNLTKLVLETMFSFYDMFQEKGYEPIFEVEEMPYTVFCNAVAVKRVISNIIKNALLHGTGYIKIGYGKKQERIFFVCENPVEDPDSMEVEQIFHRFYKADKARSEKSTGLGLAIAKEMVEKMHGEISGELEGNVFRIKISFPLVF